jgi:hypothetical protein
MKASYQEKEKIMKLTYTNWQELKKDLMENTEDNKNFCEETLKGTWKQITETSIKAICNYSSEITSSDLSKDPDLNEWVIFYKSLSPEETSIRDKKISLVPEVKAQSSLACTSDSSIEIPIVEIMNNSIDFAEKLIDELEKIKNYSQNIINETNNLILLPENCLGSNCDSQKVETEWQNCCSRDCNCHCDCDPCPPPSEGGESSFLEKTLEVLKIRQIYAFSCNCPDCDCPPCDCKCGGGCDWDICDYCQICTAGYCAECSGDPCPSSEIKEKVENISNYINNDECENCDIKDTIEELDSLINKEQENFDGKTYKEKIMEDLEATAKLFADPKYGNNFPKIGSKEYEQWKLGEIHIPHLIDKEMAPLYGINTEEWEKLMKNPFNFYLCLPYVVK